MHNSWERDPLDHRHFMSDMPESQLWHNIRMAAKTNPALQEALDRAKIIYYLSTEENLLNNNIPPGHHPV